MVFIFDYSNKILFLKTINNYLKKIVKHTLKYVMIIIKNTLDTLYIKGKTILGQ